MKVTCEFLSQPVNVIIVEDNCKYIAEKKNAIWDSFVKANPDIVKKVIPGFRPDNVPRSLGEKKFNVAEIYEELFNEVLFNGLKQTGMSIASVNSQNLELGSNDSFIQITAEVDLVPSVTLGSYKGIPIKYEPLEASDGEIEATLQRARESYGTVQGSEGPIQNGNIATIEYIGKIDGKVFEGGSSNAPYDLHIGAGKFIAGFEEQLIGVRKGEKKTLNITFPEMYYREELKGKAATFDVDVKDVKVKVLPELDDDFARTVGYKNLLDARDCLKKDLSARKVRQNESLIDDQIMNSLSEICTVSPIPQKIVMEQVGAELERVIKSTGLTKEKYFERTRTSETDFIRRYKPMIEKEIKVRYILDRIAETENIGPDSVELDAAVAEEAKQKKCSTDKIDREKVKRNKAVLMTLDFLKKNAVIEQAIVREI